MAFATSIKQEQPASNSYLRVGTEAFKTSSKYTDDFEDDSKDKRHIIGLRDNETRLNGQTVSVDVQEKEKQDEKEGILPPHRRIEGYSSEDEDAEGRGITYPKADVQKKGQRSSSSSSSSSSRSRSRSRSCSRSRSHSRSRSRSRSSSRSRSGSSSSERPKSPKQPERIIHARPRTPEPSGEKKISREETVQKVVDVSTARSDGGDTARSSGSTSSDLTTETESSPRSLTPKPPVTGGPTKRTRSSSSSSSSTLTSDTEDEKFTRKKREEKIRQENEQRRKQEEEERKKEQEKREQERKQKLQMEEERRQVEEEERKKRFMLQRNESQERLKKMEEDRKAKEAELNRQKEEEKQKRMADEERIKRDFEKQLSFIQSQRESGTATSLSDERKPKIVEKTDIGRTSEQTKRRGSTSSTASSSSSSSSSSGREYVVKKEEKPQPALRAVARKSSSSSSSESEKETKPPVIKQQVQEENVMQRKHSSSSSTSSKSEEETKQSTFPVMTRQMESLNAEYKDLAVQRRHTTSSSSSSEDESEAKPKPATTSAKITAAETKTVLPVKSLSPVEAKKSSSTSSLTSSSSDSESDSQADKLVPKPVQSVKPPSPVEAKKPSPSTSSVTSSSSDSESSSEADKPVPKPRTPSPELKRPEPQRATAPHAARESSGSSSDSDSSSEADKPVPKPRTPSPELKKPATPMAAAPHAARESSGSSSDSDSSSSLSDSEDKSPVKQDVVKQEESQQSSPKLEKKPFEMRGGGIAQQRDREETEDSSTDSSSSSDSESDSEEKAKPKTATDESDHNYGGHDPDNVAQSSGSKDGSLGLTSVPAPKAHFGSILPMVEGDTALELSGVKLTDSQVAELSNFITKNHDLKSVTLRNSALEDTSFLSLARALQMSPSNPSIVNLGLNNLGPDSMTAFANVIKNKPAMEVIILNGNPLGDVGCKLLCDALIKTKDPFPFLRRTSGYLSPAEARQQKDQGKEVKYDSHNDEGCNLKQLDLSETKIGDAGIGEISRFLDSNKTLTSLSLNGNTAVTASGWERLGQAMKKNTTLKSMSIDHAGIGDTGLEGLVKGLRVNVGLRSLELEHAGLTEKGGLILRDLVKGNTSIVDLSITRGNDISENMVEEIRKYLALNRSMLS